MATAIKIKCLPEPELQFSNGGEISILAGRLRRTVLRITVDYERSAWA